MYSPCSRPGIKTAKASGSSRRLVFYASVNKKPAKPNGLAGFLLLIRLILIIYKADYIASMLCWLYPAAHANKFNNSRKPDACLGSARV